jgi:hypothetical protein
VQLHAGALRPEKHGLGRESWPTTRRQGLPPRNRDVAITAATGQQDRAKAALTVKAS